MYFTSALVAALTTTLVSAQQYRYRNPRSTPYLIDALPNVTIDIGKLYGGSVAINETDPPRSLFFQYNRAGKVV